MLAVCLDAVSAPACRDAYIPAAFAGLFETARKSNRPVVLTVKAKAAAIVQDAEAYQRLLDIAAQADAQRKASGKAWSISGRIRFRPAREFFAGFEARKGTRWP